MSTAVFDTSFWIHAYGAGLIPAVRARYALRYTMAVGAELPESYASGREFWRLVRAGDLVLATVAQERLHRFAPGERSALNAALDHPEWALLLDDRRPYEEAERLGLSVVCSPLLVVALYAEGTVDSRGAARLLAALADLGTLSPRLVRLGVDALARARAVRGDE